MNDASETITNDNLSKNYGSLAPASKENDSSRTAHNEMPPLSAIAMSAIFATGKLSFISIVLHDEDL